MKTLLIIDANSLIYRAYHALPPLTSPGGETTGAVYGFAAMIIRALKELRPNYAVAAFDLPGPTFRHVRYQAYKATRPPMPVDLLRQIEKCREVVLAFGITALGVPGFEADDIIGTFTNSAKNNQELQVVILSGDLDLLQLAAERIKISMPKRGISDITEFDSQAVRERYGFGPELLADYKALRGDPSDNIPGVHGVGEKTAALLIVKFGNIENLYREIESNPKEAPPLTGALRKKLILGKESAFLSKALVIINTFAPIDLSLEKYVFAGTPMNSRVEELFSQLGFKTLIERIKGI